MSLDKSGGQEKNNFCIECGYHFDQEDGFCRNCGLDRGDLFEKHITDYFTCEGCGKR